MLVYFGFRTTSYIDLCFPVGNPTVIFGSIGRDGDRQDTTGDRAGMPSVSGHSRPSDQKLEPLPTHEERDGMTECVTSSDGDFGCIRGITEASEFAPETPRWARAEYHVLSTCARANVPSLDLSSQQ